MLKIPDIVYELYLHVAWESCELYKFQQNGRNMSIAATQKHFFRLCQISHLWKNVFLSVCQEVF